MSMSGEFENITDAPENDIYDGFPTNYNQKVGMVVGITILGLWSTFGNLLTIATILSRHYMDTKTNVFILSLAFSDLFSGLIASPLWVYRRTFGFKEWVLGSFACKLFAFTDEATTYCTAMHIATFAIWRYVGIRSPETRIKIKMRWIQICIGTIWIVAVLFGGIPWAFFYDVVDKVKYGSAIFSHWPHCSLDIRNNGLEKYMIYYTFSSTTFLYFPLAVLLVASVLIIIELNFNVAFKSKLRQTKERAAIAQLILIAMSFLVGYIPMTIYMTWTTRVTGKSPQLDYWLQVAAYFCLRVSECFNPIAYNIASKKMRKASKEVLLKLACCGKYSRKMVCQGFVKENKGAVLHAPIPLSGSSGDSDTNNTAISSSA